MKGFTLVELITVLAIATLLAAIAVPAYMQSQNSQEAKMRNVALQLRSTLLAARTYAITTRSLAGVFYYHDTQGGSGYFLAAPSATEVRTVQLWADAEKTHLRSEEWPVWDFLPGNAGKFRKLPPGFELNLENSVGVYTLSLTHTPDRSYSVLLASEYFITTLERLGAVGVVRGHVFGPTGGLGHGPVSALKQSVAVESSEAYRKLEILSTTGNVRIKT